LETLQKYIKTGYWRSTLINYKIWRTTHNRKGFTDPKEVDTIPEAFMIGPPPSFSLDSESEKYLYIRTKFFLEKQNIKRQEPLEWTMQEL